MDQTALLEAMTREVRARCEQRIDNARQEAMNIETEAKNRCAEERRIALETAESQMKQLIDNARVAADTEVKKRERAIVGLVAEQTMAEAESTVREFANSREFPPILDRLVEEAIADVDGKLIVRTAPAHVDVVRRWIEVHHRHDIEVIADPAVFDGVVVEDTNRSFRITNTLTVRFDMLREKIRAKCIEILSRYGDAGTE